MHFSEEVKQLIHQVEETSGRRIYPAPTPHEGMRAQIRESRGSSVFHFLEYNSSLPHYNYLVAKQLIGLNRILSLPPNERWNIASTRSELNVGIRAMGLKTCGKKFAQSFLEGIITQMRNTCIGLRVESWIHSEMQGLRKDQEYDIRTDFWEQELKRELDPDALDHFPENWVKPRNSMLAACAQWRAKLIGEPRIALPYTALGYGEIANKLLDALNEVPDDPAGDKALVERWANILGLSGAFHFVPQNLLDSLAEAEDDVAAMIHRVTRFAQNSFPEPEPAPQYEGPKLEIICDDLRI
jgi:hypothetical protein